MKHALDFLRTLGDRLVSKWHELDDFLLWLYEPGNWWRKKRAEWERAEYLRSPARGLDAVAKRLADEWPIIEPIEFDRIMRDRWGWPTEYELAAGGKTKMSATYDEVMREAFAIPFAAALDDELDDDYFAIWDKDLHPDGSGWGWWGMWTDPPWRADRFKHCRIENCEIEVPDTTRRLGSAFATPKQSFRVLPNDPWTWDSPWTTHITTLTVEDANAISSYL